MKYFAIIFGALLLFCAPAFAQGPAENSDTSTAIETAAKPGKKAGKHKEEKGRQGKKRKAEEGRKHKGKQGKKHKGKHGKGHKGKHGKKHGGKGKHHRQRGR